MQNAECRMQNAEIRILISYCACFLDIGEGKADGRWQMLLLVITSNFGLLLLLLNSGF